MKKAYETPMVEMIAFRYRDQVVAASGVLANQDVTGSNTRPGANEIVDYIMNGLGVRSCDTIGDIIGGIIG